MSLDGNCSHEFSFVQLIDTILPTFGKNLYNFDINLNLSTHTTNFTPILYEFIQIIVRIIQTEFERDRIQFVNQNRLFDSQSYLSKTLKGLS